MIEEIKDTVETVEEMLSERKYRELRTFILDYDPQDAAEILDSVDENYIPILFRILPKP